MKRFFIAILTFLLSSFVAFAQSPYGKVLFLNSLGQQVWDFLPPQSIQNAAWALVGNNISATHFLGTTNAFDLVIKTNNIERMRIYSG
ncbi:MAG: hypothetical protein N2517_03310, partial [Ignavibacteria bacterium]|nr:hypothetical protein [Ignavibacteria bacterium]